MRRRGRGGRRRKRLPLQKYFCRLRPCRRVLSAVAATTLAIGRTSGAERILCKDPEIFPTVDVLVDVRFPELLFSSTHLPTELAEVTLHKLPKGAGTYKEIFGIVSDNWLPCSLTECQAARFFFDHRLSLDNDICLVMMLVHSNSGPLVLVAIPVQGSWTFANLSLESLHEAGDDTSWSWDSPIVVVKPVKPEASRA